MNFPAVAGSALTYDPGGPVGVAEPVPFWDAAEASERDMLETRNQGVREEQVRVADWERKRRFEQLTGRTLKPSRFMLGEHAPTRGFDPLSPGMEGVAALEAQALGLDDDAYEAQFAGAQGVETRAEMLAKLDKQWREVRAKAEEAASSGPAGIAGSFVGGAYGAIQDPANLVATLATGGIGASRSLATRVITQAGVNAGIEATQIPGRISDTRYGGPEYTAKEAGTDVLFAAGAGAGFEIAGDLAKAGIRAAARPFIQQSVRDDAPVRRAVEILDAGDRDDLAIGGRDGEIHAAAVDALDRMTRPNPAPVRDLSTFPAEGSVDYYGRPIHARRFDPDSLQADPVRFQYKDDADAEGVTARLRGVEAWDATASGKALAWEDRSGTLFVADGHQRRKLGQRMKAAGWDAELDGFLFREADGWDWREVRTVAALKNLREGSGTPLDAAKIFRDAPSLLADRSIPVTGEFMGLARGLSALSDDAFRMAVNKVIDERYAAEIGLGAAHRPDLHADMARLLKEADPANADEARALVVEALTDDWIKREGDQADLFGYDPSTSGLIARAKIAATVKRELAKDARLFSGLVKNADAIEAGGNALARDANEARLAMDRAALEITSKLALRHGPVGEAMTAAVKAVTAGETPAKAAKAVIARVRAAIEAGERLDEVRAEILNPPPPSAAARELVEPFDEVGGAGAKGQAVAAPEDAALEAGEEIPGLFDDLLDDGPDYEAAHKALVACVPGAAE